MPTPCAVEASTHTHTPHTRTHTHTHTHTREQPFPWGAHPVGAVGPFRRGSQVAVRQWILYGAGSLMFTALYMALLDPVARTLHMGVLCACTSMLMFGSPLAGVVRGRATAFA